MSLRTIDASMHEVDYSATASKYVYIYAKIRCLKVLAQLDCSCSQSQSSCLGRQAGDIFKSFKDMSPGHINS